MGGFDLASAFITGVFANLFTAAIQRGSSVLFHKAARLQKIDLTLRGEAKRNTEIARAINDFETFLGTYRGEFDEHIDRFLSELSQSGILAAIAENALLGQACAQTERLFCNRFRATSPTHPMDPADLYRQLSTSFTITLREITKDPILADMVRASSAHIERRLESISYAIETFSTLKDTPQPIEISDKIKICRALSNAYRNVRIETVKSGAREVAIDRIYITPRLKHRTFGDENLPHALRLISKHHRSKKDSPEELLTIRGTRQTETTLRERTYSEFRNSFRRTVILGDPGGGKSTLCQKLCFDLTKNYLLSLQAGDNGKNVPNQSKKLAIRVILRKFEQARLRDPQLDLFSYICRDIKNLSGVSTEVIEAYLREVFESGNAAFAFDGLDEILDTSRRRDFVDLVNAFCDQYPLSPAFVTSRFVGYEDAPLPSEFSELLLSQLNTDEVFQYLKKFLQVVAGKKAKESESEAKRFILQTESNASDLRQNPLLLGLMAFLFNVRGDVPSNRPEIYSDCSTLMFERWDKNRGINPDVPNDFERAELFSDLASRMFGDDKLRAGVSRGWLKQTVRSFFVDLYLDNSKAISSSNSITEFLVGRAWVMSEVGDGVFAFTHQTFLEYFFARYLDGTYDTVEELLDILFPRIVAQEWDVVSHLALQLKTHGNIRRQDEALNWLSRKLSQYKSKRHNQTLKNFAARSLEYLSGSESALLSMLKGIVVIPDSYGRNQIGPHLDTVDRAIHASHLRTNFVQSAMTNILADLVLRESILASRLRSTLGPMIGFPVGNRQGRWASIRQLAPSIRQKARERIIRFSASQGMSAGMALQWYGHYRVGDAAKFGLTPFAEDFLPDLPAGGLNWLALAAHKSYRQNFLPEGVPIASILSFINDVERTPINTLLRDYSRVQRSEQVPLEVWLDLLRSQPDGPERRVMLVFFLIDYPHFADRFGSGLPKRLRRQASTRTIDSLKKLLLSELDKPKKGMFAFDEVIAAISSLAP